MTKYEELLNKLIAQNDRIKILTAENKAALREIPEIIGDSFIDVGIAEQSLVGISAGMALRNKIPIAHALAAFLSMRSFEFIRTDCGYPNLPVKLVGSFAGFLSSANGPTHQAVEDCGIMAGIPNMSVFCPADLDDMLKCLPDIIEHNGPVYIRYNDTDSGYEHSDYEFGKAEEIYSGKDLTILTFGVLFDQAKKSADMLRQQGIDAGLLNLRTMKPIDKELILEKIRDNKLVVCVEDHFIDSGLYSILCKMFIEEGTLVPILPIGLTDWFKPVPFDEVLKYEGFTAEAISKKIVDMYEQLNG